MNKHGFFSDAWNGLPGPRVVTFGALVAVPVAFAVIFLFNAALQWVSNRLIETQQRILRYRERDPHG